ncbi:MAG: PEP-CTERM sorting domain-containing protein [Chthoniobacterales bacterium]
MKNILILTAVATFSLLSVANGQIITLSYSDWASGTNPPRAETWASLPSAIVANPDGSGNAGLFARSGYRDYTEVRDFDNATAPNGGFLFPAGVVAGTDSISMSLDIYIINSAVVSNSDTFSLYFRWNDLGWPEPEPVKTYNVSSLARDTWHTLSFDMPQLIPATAGGSPTVSVTPFFSWYQPTSTSNGDAFYLTNWNVTATIPEPGTALLGILGIGGLAFLRRRKS